MLFIVLNNEFVAGLIGLVSVYLPRSHSHAWSTVAVLSVGAILKANTSQGSVATPFRYFGNL